MSSLRLALAAAALTLLPTFASATSYSFQATEMSALSPSSVTFTFSLDTATASLSPSGGTLFNNVSITENGMTVAGNNVFAQYGTDLGSTLFFFIDTSLQPFFTGSGTEISFNIGTFAIADGATDGEGTLQISSNASPAPSATPEPSSLALLGTGVLGVIGTARRRFA